MHSSSRSNFPYPGVGAEEYGPPAPSIGQQSAQAVTDINRSVEQSTGLKNFAMYLGVGLIGYVVYEYMNE